MNTKMVIESGFKPLSGVEEGAEAIFHVVTSPGIEWRTGLSFNSMQPD